MAESSEQIDPEAFLRTRVRAVYALQVPMIGMDVLGSCLIAWCYWNPASAHLLGLWLAITFASLIPRAALALAHRQGRLAHLPARFWAGVLIGFAGAAGLMWGVALAWMLAVGSDAQVTFVMCVALSGLMLTITNITIWPVYAVFAAPVIAAAAIGFAVSGRFGHMMLALGAMMTMIALLVTSRRLAREVLRAHRLAFANQALIDSLGERSRELEQACRVLEQVSRTDPLTGLANRRSRDDRLSAEWDRAIRFGATLAVIAIDVDHFKRYNDTHGHAEGDRCLQAVAEVLAQTTRGPIDLAARHGGEEFMLIMPGVDAGAAASIAERVRVRIATCNTAPAYALPERVTVSLGVATITPGPGRSVHELTIAADAALYRAKMNGRNRYELAPPLDGHPEAAVA
jgi:diguanylate cyclase (GGDEF)-like protein